MRIVEVLRSKGGTVLTVGADATVGELVATLAEHGVGALVVTGSGPGDDPGLAGIVSERDVVRGLVTQGAGLLNRSVAEIMTRSVTTCGPDDGVDDVMRLMTERRVRHVPVVDGGRLAGIVSIGDVVKARMDELTSERDHLSAYITT